MMGKLKTSIKKDSISLKSIGRKFKKPKRPITTISSMVKTPSMKRFVNHLREIKG